MSKFKKLYFEDSQDAGYSTTLETPRQLGPKDLIFVENNKTRAIGEEVISYSGEVLKGSKILKNDDEFFQYSHYEGEVEVHIESVELYRNLWLSIHIPASSLPL
ncbi:hypothetical protein Acj9p210 [Acinetobacter phage Acj9]|uniref:Uncharacterized protein n=1 Tax=Acinetobacter phage Acj9 TaxID=760939 RepID=E5EPZ4_9CAUD|nr:hypothetical protein Acj9p210 [Acinetobacter phage Acj9]ADG60110.1 hypothetical protein Acj9p210 [Acinetobacter phage Acj9]